MILSAWRTHTNPAERDMQRWFRQLLAEHQESVYNQAYRMLGNREEAEEATQDVFLRVYRGLRDFRGESKLSTWIYRITTNICINRLQLKKLNTVSLDKPLTEQGRPVAEVIAGLMDSPDEQYQRRQLAKILEKQVRRLPEKWAQAINLHHFQGFSYTEVAEMMKLPRATVASYVLRGRQQLTRALIARLGKAGINSYKGSYHG